MATNLSSTADTDEEIERRTIRSISLRLVPFLMVLYFVAFIDRVNVGFAAFGMNRDLGFGPAVFGFGAGIFFLGYFLLEVPSNLALERFGARIWIARVMVTWGFVAGAMAFTRGPVSFYVLRFLLGAAEAGFFPGIILYLSHWFPARHRASVTALFMAAAPLSTALGSPLSASLLQLNGWLGFAGWQWMFLIEAVPAILLGGVVLVFLTDRPEQASWLPEAERLWLVRAMRAEHDQRRGDGHVSLWRGLSDRRVLALSLVYFGTSAGLYTLGIWSPQIIESHGLTPWATGLVNAIPPLVSTLAMIAWSRHSDRTGERTWHVASACLLASAGLLAAGYTTSVVGVVVALTVVNIGISSAKPPLWSLPTRFLSGTAAAAGIAVINSIGNLGGFVGPAMIGWIKQTTGRYDAGLVFVSGLLTVSAVVTLVVARAAPRRSEYA